MINTKEESSSEEEEDEEDEVYVSYIVKLFINFRNSNRCSSSELNLTFMKSFEEKIGTENKSESLEFDLYKISNFISERAGKRRLDPMWVGRLSEMATCCAYGSRGVWRWALAMFFQCGQEL